MFGLNEVVAYFKEVTSSLKFQIAATITFGAALLLVWLNEVSESKITLIILFLFPLCMFIGTIVEKAIDHSKEQKKLKYKKLERKLGLLERHEWTDILTDLWQDSNFEGLGWQIYLNVSTNSAYLTHPCCYNCKTNLLTKKNSTCDGFYLECNDCKNTFDVDDVGEKRHIANSSFQGEVRRNPDKYFRLF